MGKTEVYERFKELEIKLNDELGQKRADIVNELSKILVNKSKESKITDILSKPLKEFFPDAILENKTSRITRFFPNKMFCCKPGPDFVINSERIVGEVKYDKLGIQKLSQAIGQIMLYLATGRCEQCKYEYGCVIFFNKSGKHQCTQIEENFIKHMWDSENIFIIII